MHMHKIFLIIRREFLTRVKKKSFIIMTILGPILLSSLMIIPIWLLVNQAEKCEKVAIIDKSLLFTDILPGTKTVEFIYPKAELEVVKQGLKRKEYDLIVEIPENIV